MGKRDWASFFVILAFGASLVATSKPRDEEDEPRARGKGGEGGFASASAAADGGSDATALAIADASAEAEAPKAALRTLPDTSSWKPFAYAPGKLQGKTPPNAEVTCTTTGTAVTCALVKSKRTIALFVQNGLGPKPSCEALKRAPYVQKGIIYEDEFDVASIVENPNYDSTCDFVASSPAGLTAVTRTDTTPMHQSGDLNLGAAISANDCLEAIAFARALVKTGEPGQPPPKPPPLDVTY